MNNGNADTLFFNASGPQRYDYDEKYKTWFYHRDNHTLEQVLNDELSIAFGYKIDLLKDFDPQEE